MFFSLIPSNVVKALAEDELLAVIITAIIVGYLVESPRSPIVRVTEEIEHHQIPHRGGPYRCLLPDFAQPDEA
ncbi:hypothetical protein LB505_006375 [Fusarium chuoi]|nr:hypothetical protein LB505_006375 [Fusarium chuoi]